MSYWERDMNLSTLQGFPSYWDSLGIFPGWIYVIADRKMTTCHRGQAYKGDCKGNQTTFSTFVFESYETLINHI